VWQIPWLPQVVPSVTSLQADGLTLDWQVSQGFVGSTVPLAYVVPPMVHPAPDSVIAASGARSVVASCPVASPPSTVTPWMNESVLASLVEPPS
jgi:hypothetical protein